MNLDQVLAKIDSWSTIVLLGLFFAFMISGYMITRGLVDRYLGLILHNELDLPIMTVFTIHSTIRIRFYLLRKKIVNRFKVNLISILIAVIPFSLIVYFDIFFQLG